MGWRDRDYARFNDEERKRFYGGGGLPLPPSDEVRESADLVAPPYSAGPARSPSPPALIWFQSVEYPLLTIIAGLGLWLLLNWLGVMGGTVYLHQ